ncbi:MAG: caspase domain-containing protein, partial [Tagaea sp.]
MRKYAGKLGTLLIGTLMAALPVGPAFATKKVALVVGNANYAEAPLRNPVNDARAIARQLRGKGFEVLLRENVTKAQFSEAVADFGERISAGDTALFFYAGHGLQVQGRNYLVPIDARITSEQRVRLEAMDVEAVLDQTTAAKAKVSLVILDACRNNPFERRFRSTGGGLAQINAPEGTLIAYATAPGKVAADGEGSNGLYTQALLSALAEPGLKVEEVFKNVRIEVARVSGGAQIPWEASSLTGDFFFVPPVEQTAVREAMFWDSVKGSTDPAELNAYLTLYPNGHFAPIARARIAAVEAARALATAEAERNRQAADAARQAAEAARAREVQE